MKQSHTGSSRQTHTHAPLATYLRARRCVYELLLSPEVERPVERLVRAAIFVLILANVFAVVAETVPSIRARFANELSLFEAFSVGIFTIEYVFRLWAAVEHPRFGTPFLGRIRYVFSFYALVDLVAILPFFIPRMVHCDMRFVRGLRLIRLLRVFKLGRYSTSLSMYGQILREKRDELVVSFALLMLLLLLSSSTIYWFEHEAQPQHFSSIPQAMWWGVVTLTTIGYGDVVPITVGGRIFGAIVAIIGVGFVALPSAILVSGMMEHLARKKQARCPTAPKAGSTDDVRVCPHCGRPLQPPGSTFQENTAADVAPRHDAPAGDQTDERPL